MKFADFRTDPALVTSLKAVINSEADTKSGIEKFSQRISHMVHNGGGFTPLDLERVLGNNDLVRINYLERGLIAAKSVARIFVADDFGTAGSWGTGFLITPNLFITNHHVIKSPQEAMRSFVEFGFESDIKGIPKQAKRFTLRPELGFITSNETEFDFSIIAISETSEDRAARISEFGYLRLNPQLHKVEENEFVTIIQHPEGQEKLIAIRENKVIKIGDRNQKAENRFIWYSSDTAPGSSGAPVLNDSWQVVCIHHKTIPSARLNESGIVEYQLSTGEWKTESEIESFAKIDIQYVANEGVRVSCIVEEAIKIYNELKDSEKSNFFLIREFIDDAKGIKMFPQPDIILKVEGGERSYTGLFGESFDFEKRKMRSSGRNVKPASQYDSKDGYNPNFLGIEVPHPELTNVALAFGTPSKLTGTDKIELKYRHFSVVQNATRRLAFYTAVNIDGSKWNNLNRENDKWSYDPRISLDEQLGNEFYSNEPGNYFDRGHLVRRLDPVWGNIQEATEANFDTFHWTNCSPQYFGFNQGKELWQGLENYILYNTDQEDIKATVFTGPVFSKNDEEHRGILIPQYFWKVVVVTDARGKIYSSAYVVSQEKYAKNIPFEELPVRDFNQFQTTVKKLEKVTGLNFPEIINKSDVRNGDSADLPLRSLADIAVPRR